MCVGGANSYKYIFTSLNIERKQERKKNFLKELSVCFNSQLRHFLWDFANRIYLFSALLYVFWCVNMFVFTSFQTFWHLAFFPNLKVILHYQLWKWNSTREGTTLQIYWYFTNYSKLSKRKQLFLFQQTKWIEICKSSRSAMIWLNTLGSNEKQPCEQWNALNVWT